MAPAKNRERTRTSAVSHEGNVHVEFDEGIAWVAMNRPEKRNAMNPALNDEMLKILDGLEVDDACGVVVLTGMGDSFSAGMDLKEFFRDLDKLSYTHQVHKRRSAWQWQWRQLMAYPKPTIAMVNGWCFGGAFTPLIACDLAIAAEDAVFGLSEINWGIIPGGNVTRSVVAAMNLRDAMYYVMTGETFDGRKAAAMGLVNEAVPRAALRARVHKLATTLLEKNPMALRIAKHATRRVRDMSWEDAEDYLFAKLDQLRFLDPEKGREKGMTQFLDDKSYRPGLAAYRRDS
jgi:feruloyl-CoA hydratase/lyase